MYKTSDKSGLMFKLDLIIWTVAFVLTLPLALILCIPIAIYRKLVEISAKINRPDLDRIVPPAKQSIFHNNFDQDGRMTLNIVTWHTLKGTSNVENLRKIVQGNLINQVGPNGKLEFPEFQQYFSFYGGYTFHKWDQTFDASNHVRYLEEAQEGSVVTESDLQKIISQLMSKGWPNGRSPWEILVVKNYRVDSNDSTDKSLLIFRFHHSLMDGYSYLNCVVRRLYQADNPVAAISLSKKFTRWEKMKFFVASSLRQPYDFVKMFKTADKEPSSWNLPSGTLSNEYSVVWSQPISVDVIKKIKSSYGVSFQSVLNSIVGGTIQGLMTRVDQTVPPIMNAFVPFPAGDHPGGLCIHTHFSLVKVPIAAKDPVRRLEIADEFWIQAIHSTARWMSQKVVVTLAWLPWTVGDKILHNHLTNIGITCFPGVQGEIFLDEHEVLEVNFAVGTDRDCSAATFTTLSCFGTLRFVMIIDKSVYPDEDVGQYFNEYVQKEVQSLMDPKKLNQVVEGHRSLTPRNLVCLQGRRPQ